MLTGYFAEYVTRYRPYKNGNWCYEDGCIYRGLELLHQSTGDARWLEHLQRLVDARITEGPGLSGFDAGEYNIDNILPGRALIYLYAQTGAQIYLDCAQLLIGQLADHPRTKSGVYWHKARYPWQIWLDGLYMGLPFQITFGQATGRTALVLDAMTQLETALSLTHVPGTGLYAHAYDEARQQPWADGITGQSRAHWARALGWLSMALVDIAELVGAQQFAPIRPRAEQLLARIGGLQQPSGLWLQVIDQPELEGNYPESSASAMFAYALAKGGAIGLCPMPGPGSFERLSSGVMRGDTAADLRMVEICEVAGLGDYQGRYRDGSAAYYVSEARVADDAKGVGPLMMSYSAHEANLAGRRSLAGE